MIVIQIWDNEGRERIIRINLEVSGFTQSHLKYIYFVFQCVLVFRVFTGALVLTGCIDQDL